MIRVGWGNSKHIFIHLSGECNLNSFTFSKVQVHKIGNFGRLIDL